MSAMKELAMIKDELNELCIPENKVGVNTYRVWADEFPKISIKERTFLQQRYGYTFDFTDGEFVIIGRGK